MKSSKARLRSIIVGLSLVLVDIGAGATPVVRAASCTPASRSVMGWWPGESIGAPNSISDVSGDRPGQRESDDVTSSAAKVGNGLHFAGESGVVLPRTLGGGREATIEGWIKWEPAIGTFTIFSGQNSSRFDKTNDVLNLHHAFANIEIESNNGTTGTVKAEVWGDYAAAGFDPDAFADNASIRMSANLPSPVDGFHHVAVTVAASMTRLYVDGIVVHSVPATMTEIIAATDSSYIGRRAPVFPGPAQSFRGTIDELSIYTGALSDSQIKKIVQADSAGKCAVVGPTPPDGFALGPVVRNASEFDVSPPLCPNAPSPSSVNLSNPAASPGDMAPPLVNFEGLRQDEQPYGLDPSPDVPDPTGAAGPNHYVQMTNDAMAIYDKSGNRLCGPLKNGQVWEGTDTSGPCAGYLSDGIVLYDRKAARWVLTRFAFPGPDSYSGTSYAPSINRFQCVAVSTSSDPTGTYNVYAFRVSARLIHDYPKLGSWSDGYYFTGAADAEETKGVEVAVFERNKMINGQSARMQVFLIPSNGRRDLLLLPSDLEGTKAPPKGSPNYLLGLQDDNGGFSSDGLQVWRLHTDWGTPRLSSLVRLVVPTGSFNAQPCGGCVKQLVGFPSVSEMPNRLMNRLVYRRFKGFEEIVATHFDGALKSSPTFRWYELRKTKENPDWSIRQQATAYDVAFHAGGSLSDARWMSSIAMDRSNNIAVGYSVSGPTTIPSIRYAGRSYADPLNQLPRTEATLKSGENVKAAGGAWGDYTHLSIDPADDCTFWYTNEYYASDSNENWHTRIGAFRFPGCGPSGSPTGG